MQKMDSDKKKKTGSLRFSLLGITLCAICAVFVIMSVCCIWYVHKTVSTEEGRILKLIARNKAQEIEDQFKSIERSVNNLEGYIRNNFDPERALSDGAYRDDFMDKFSVFAESSAKSTEDVIMVYFRPNADVFAPDEGILLMGDNYGGYSSITPTDVSAYDPNDIEHVGWYYIPLKTGYATWMEPYENLNVGVRMLSYVTPIYFGQDFIGVAGMDISTARLRKSLENIDYGNTYTFLMASGGNMICHKDYPYGLNRDMFPDDLKELTGQLNRQSDGQTFEYRYNGERCIAAVSVLENGMILVATAPDSDYLGKRLGILNLMLLLALPVTIITVVVINRISRKLIKPLEEMADAADKISKGHVNVSVSCDANDEMGRLAESINMMGRELDEYIGIVRKQAFTDAMTGINNKDAYLETRKVLERKIDEGMARFTIFVMDLNYLKQMNDQYGHEFGDMLISDAATVLQHVFGEDRVYRVGGDEFVALLEDTESIRAADYAKSLDLEIREFNAGAKRYELPLALAYGYSSYDREHDRYFDEVFSRADESMYEMKSKMKGTRLNEG